MRRYPHHVRTRVTAKTGALLEHHADVRGLTPATLARDLISEGILRLDNEPTTPLWLEMIAVENYRLRAVVLRLLEAVGEDRGWTRDYLTQLLDRTRANADEYAHRRLAEIEKMRLDGAYTTRR